MSTGVRRLRRQALHRWTFRNRRCRRRLCYCGCVASLHMIGRKSKCRSLERCASRFEGAFDRRRNMLTRLTNDWSRMRNGRRCVAREKPEVCGIFHGFSWSGEMHSASDDPRSPFFPFGPGLSAEPGHFLGMSGRIRPQESLALSPGPGELCANAKLRRLRI